jgi:hypothetical protein
MLGSPSLKIPIQHRWGSCLILPHVQADARNSDFDDTARVLPAFPSKKTKMAAALQATDASFEIAGLAGPTSCLSRR